MDRPNNINENSADRKLKETAGTSMPYDVPDAYFEELPGRILARIHEVPDKRVGFRPGFIHYASAAAVLVLVALTAIHFLFNTVTEYNTEEAFSIEDIYRYNLDNMLELEETYLMSFIEDDGIDMSGLLTDEVDNISDEVIVEYLLAENHIEYYLLDEY